MQHKNKKQSERETRVHLTPQRFEVRSNADGSRSISGYAVVFNSLSDDLGGFKEVVKAGAFQKTLRDNPDVLCLYGHDQNQILGRVSSGTLTIGEDNVGLRFTCKLPDTSTARDLIALMERGDVSQMSFGFSVPQGGDEWTEVNGQIIRTLVNVTLWECSVVGVPAYSATSVNLRSCPLALRSKLTDLPNVFRLELDERDESDCPDGVDADDPECTEDRSDDDDSEENCDPESPDYDEDADCDEERAKATAKANADLLLRRLR